MKRNQIVLADWVEKHILNNKQRYIVIHGGRGSGKSEGIAQVLLLRSMKERKIRIICGRERQRTIRESSKAVIEKWISEWNLNKYFDITHYSIKNKITKSEFLFFGLSDVTKNNITSVSNIKYLWIDEAHMITKDTWIRTYPSIRAPGSQIFITFNPHFEDDILYKEFVLVKRSDTFVLQVNWRDNPWFYQTPLKDERLIDYDIKPRAYYNHVWEGGLCEYNDNAVIDINRFNRYSIYEEYKYDKIVIALDTAFSTKEYSDYSAIGAFGRIGDDFHVLRIHRGKWEFHDLKNELLFFYKNIISKYKSVDKIIVENKSAGTSLIQEIRRTTSLNITPDNPTKDKYTRVIEALEILHTGRFYIPLESDVTTEWLKPYLLELSMFTPNNMHDHDDQVDITTMSIKYLNDINTIDYAVLNELLDSVYNM